MRKSRFLALIAVFASLNVVCDSFVGIPQFTEGIWYSWIFIIEPLTGIVLGPYAGFLSTFLGVMIGHFIFFRGAHEFLFTFGAPIGAMVSGFLFRGKWKVNLAYYTMLLGIYFITPIAWQLPIWGMWDVYLAYASLLVSITLMVRKGSWKLGSRRQLLYAIVLCAFVGLEADVLFRIFVFVPCQTYRILWKDIDLNVLRLIWVAGAAVTPIQVAISILVTTTIGLPLVKLIRKTGILKEESIFHA